MDSTPHDHDHGASLMCSMPHMKKTVLPEEIEGTRRAMLIRQVEKKWTNNT